MLVIFPCKAVTFQPKVLVRYKSQMGRVNRVAMSTAVPSTPNAGHTQACTRSRCSAHGFSPRPKRTDFVCSPWLWSCFSVALDLALQSLHVSSFLLSSIIPHMCLEVCVNLSVLSTNKYTNKCTYTIYTYTYTCIYLFTYV